MSYLLSASAASFDFAVIFGNILTNWYYYLALVVCLIAIAVFFVVKKPKARHTLTPTQKLTYVSVLTALCVVANCFSYFPVSYISVSFTYTVCFIAGYVLGAKAGFAVGFIGDLIGGIIMPAGAYNPLIGLASGLSGLIPGIAFDYFGGNDYVKTCVSSAVNLAACTSGLNTFALWLMYGLGKKTFWAYLWVRLLWQVLVAAANLVLCLALVAIIPRVLPVGKFDFARKKDKKTDGEDPRPWQNENKSE